MSQKTKTVDITTFGKEGNRESLNCCPRPLIFCIWFLLGSEYEFPVIIYTWGIGVENI